MKREDTDVLIQGRVINTLPLEQPNRAVIQLRDWPLSIEVPLGDLKHGMHVEVSIDPLKVLEAGVGRHLPPSPPPRAL